MDIFSGRINWPILGQFISYISISARISTDTLQEMLEVVMI